MEHTLKIQPCYFEPVLSGDKTFEIRYNDDRGFQKGDTVILKEYDPNSYRYTGRTITAHITYVTQYNQKEGFVVFSFKVDNINDVT